MVRPNYFVVGANKAGITSLCAYLAQHPQVYIPSVKEPTYFSFIDVHFDTNRPDHKMALKSNVVRSEQEYYSLFDGVKDELAVGNGSTSYLATPKVAKMLKNNFPDTKIVIILRNPLDRAFSNYRMYVEYGVERELDFDKAIRQRIVMEYGENNIYIDLGMYSQQVKRYLDVFGADAVRIYLFDDLKGSADELLVDLFGFLGVDQSFRPDTSQKLNASPPMYTSFFKRELVKKSRAITRELAPVIPRFLLRRIERGLESIKRANMAKATIGPESKRYLLELFRPDILSLQKLISRDLSMWLEG